MNIRERDLSFAQALVREELAERPGRDFNALAVGEVLTTLIRLPDCTDSDRADEALDGWVSIAATALEVVARLASESEGETSC